MIVKELKKDDSLFDSAIHDELKNNEFEYISSGLNKTYLLLDNELIIGGINYSVAYDSSDILFIYINKEYRSNGYSKILLTSSLEELSKEGIKEVFLEVKKTNTVAYNLYKNVGFFTIGERKNYYKDGSDAIMMKLLIG